MSFCFIIIMALSQQLFLLFILSSWQTLTSALKVCPSASQFTDGILHLPHLDPQLFFSLTDNLFRSPGVLLICDQQDVWTQCEVLLWASPMLFWNVGEAAWCFCCTVSPQQSAAWSAYLEFIFLMIASMTLLFQRCFFFPSLKGNKSQRIFEWRLICLASAFIFWIFTSSHTGQIQESRLFDPGWSVFSKY